MLIKYHRPDYVLITIVTIFIVFGLIMLSSASVIKAYKLTDDAYYFFKHQALFGVLPGLIALLFLYNIRYQHLKKIALYLLIVGTFLLSILFLPGMAFRHAGSNSWLNLGFFTIQPSEFMKLILIIYLAGWFESFSKNKNAVTVSSVMIVISLIAGLILLQPDIGALLVLMFIGLSIYFVANGKLKYIFIGGFIVLILLSTLIAIAPYRVNRLAVFWNPELDPQGSGYQINQALLAIGSGGTLGRGFGESRQKFQYLPEVIGDSIFAIIAEEFGFIISSAIVILFLIFLYRGLLIADKAPDIFGKLLAIGIISWIIFQAFLNIGGISNILPLTGITLPFISYGGSSLLISLAAIGILLNISRQT